MNTPIKKRIKSALGRAADLTGMLARDFRSKLVVVTFHRVNDWMQEDGITCGSGKFEAFCRFFQKHFDVVPLSRQLAGCREGRGMGGTLSITFDDGSRDNYEVVAPILRRLDLPAVFFVATGFIGTDYAPPWDQQRTAAPRWMDWDQVRSLRDQGFEIGAHTDQHIDLGTMDREAVRAELIRCHAKLEEHLGLTPKLFAYPFGGRDNISPASLALVREAGFECCLGSYGGVNPPLPDPFHLNRISVGGWFATPHQLGLEILLRRA